MINSDYSKAYSEVLEIISVLPRSEYNKIPVKYIEYLEENADKILNIILGYLLISKIFQMKQRMYCLLFIGYF